MNPREPAWSWDSILISQDLAWFIRDTKIAVFHCFTNVRSMRRVIKLFQRNKATQRHTPYPFEYWRVSLNVKLRHQSRAHIGKCAKFSKFFDRSLMISRTSASFVLTLKILASTNTCTARKLHHCDYAATFYFFVSFCKNRLSRKSAFIEFLWTPMRRLRENNQRMNVRHN